MLVLDVRRATERANEAGSALQLPVHCNPLHHFL